MGEMERGLRMWTLISWLCLGTGAFVLCLNVLLLNQFRKLHNQGVVAHIVTAVVVE